MRLGFIGSGNMATAMISGVINAGVVAPQDITVSDIDIQRLSIVKALGVETVTDNLKTVTNSDVIVISVKPQFYDVVLKEIASQTRNKLIVSIAPGITIAHMQGFLTAAKIVRTMPNTPATVMEGMTFISPAQNVSQEELDRVKSIFDAFGKSAILPERLMNSAVALNGSSPAYVYILIEAMAEASVKAGIDRQTAYYAASQSVLGAARMVLETNEHPARLKDMVCSPGGTTIMAVEELENKGFRSAIMSAMDKCTKRAEELASYTNAHIK